MKVFITWEGKNSVESIQRQFKDQLSQQQILRTTARALNETSKRVQGFIKTQVRAGYTMNKKYLDRMASVGHYAKGDSSGLYVNINFRTRAIPMIAFKHTGANRQKEQIVSVTITKGKSMTLRHAFIARMRNTRNSGEVTEHEGIYGQGKYVKGKFVHNNAKTETGKPRLTEHVSTSPFTASTTKEMQPNVLKYVSTSLPSRLKYFLEKKIKKMK